MRYILRPNFAPVVRFFLYRENERRLRIGNFLFTGILLIITVNLNSLINPIFVNRLRLPFFGIVDPHVNHFASSIDSSSYSVIFEELLYRIVACNDKLGMHKSDSSPFDFCFGDLIPVHPYLEIVAEYIGV